jgi:hypothetical protein
MNGTPRPLIKKVPLQADAEEGGAVDLTSPQPKHLSCRRGRRHELRLLVAPHCAGGGGRGQAQQPGLLGLSATATPRPRAARFGGGRACARTGAVAGCRQSTTAAPGPCRSALCEWRALG